jgi:two-component system phosphate regulon response regulator PhoB
MKTILLIDDEFDTVDVLAMLLRLEGYRVLKAYDGEKGLRLAEAELPDLILSDLMMPRLNGLEVARRLAERPETRRIPLVLHSASPEPQLEGPRPYEVFLTKPAAIRDVLEIFRTLLRD